VSKREYVGEFERIGFHQALSLRRMQEAASSPSIWSLDEHLPQLPHIKKV
jgi:hypothetical protein